MSQQTEPVEGSTEPFPFIDAVGPYGPEPDDTALADQTPHADLDDPALQAEADEFAATGGVQA